MNGQNRLTRRAALGFGIGGVAGLATLGSSRVFCAEPTPAQTSGPFYPLTFPADSDPDLTLVTGHKARAAGQHIAVTGRVLDASGAPLKGARIEIWQANTHGRYDHPRDSNTAPLDPNFQGYAQLVTDAEGRYGFRTVKPGGYPAGGIQRPPHIHFDVHAGGKRLVTQLYFAGESRNEGDFILPRNAAQRALLTTTLRQPPAGADPAVLVGNWDIVLGS